MTLPQLCYVKKLIRAYLDAVDEAGYYKKNKSSTTLLLKPLEKY